VCPDVVKLRIDLEEDEDWLLANTLTQFNNLSAKANFFVIKLDNLFESVLEAAQRVADWISSLGFPIDIAMENMVPSKEWRDDVRYAKSPIGADEYNPGWDPYDFQSGANQLMGLIVLTVLLYFGGKELIRTFKSGALKKFGKRVISMVPGIMRYRQLDSIDDDLDAIMQDTDENGGLLRALAASNSSSTGGSDVELMEAIRLLTVALDSNGRNDVNALLKFLHDKHIVTEDNIFSEL